MGSTYQYYYGNNNCLAASPNDSDCACWHDEGTRPFAESVRGDGVAANKGQPFFWRIKPAEPI